MDINTKQDLLNQYRYERENAASDVKKHIEARDFAQMEANRHNEAILNFNGVIQYLSSKIAVLEKELSEVIKAEPDKDTK